MMLRRRRVLWVERRDELRAPFAISLIAHARKRRDEVDPRPAGVEGDGVVIGINEIKRTQQSGLLFPFAVERRPLEAKNLSVAEEIGEPFLTRGEQDFELVMPVALVLRKEDNDIFKCHLPAGQTIGGGN